MHFNMYVIFSDGQFVQIEDCKCYPAGYRCEPHTERVPTCTYGRFNPDDVLCCKIRKKNERSLRKKELILEHNERQNARARKRKISNKNKSSRQIHSIQHFLNMLMHRRLDKYVYYLLLFILFSKDLLQRTE